jgi:TetR/AcrR family transcriptional repressor of nem operon
MPPNPHQKARSRAEILRHAGRLFRLRGYQGTNIDDVMLAAGLTRGAFYAHFASKEALFAAIVNGGDGLLARLRSGQAKSVLKSYLDKAELAATAQGCTLAALAVDVARAPLSARLAYANVLHGAIAELAHDRKRKLDADATAAAILAIGSVILARASGDARLGDWLLRCAHRAATLLLLPRVKRRASPAKKRSRSRRKAAGGRPARRAERSRGGRAATAPKARSSAARR